MGGFACFLGYGLLCGAARQLQQQPIKPYNCSHFLIEFDYIVSYANSNPVEYFTSLIGEKGTNLIKTPTRVVANQEARFSESYYFNICKGLKSSFKVTATAQTALVLSHPPKPGTICNATGTISFDISL